MYRNIIFVQVNSIVREGFELQFTTLTWRVDRKPSRRSHNTSMQVGHERPTTYKTPRSKKRIKVNENHP
jgi:hypothetical protein